MNKPQVATEYIIELLKEINQKDAEIKELRGLIRKFWVNGRPVLFYSNENERLRELLEKALVYSHSMPTTLVAAIEKEVNDE